MAHDRPGDVAHDLKRYGIQLGPFPVVKDAHHPNGDAPCCADGNACVERGSAVRLVREPTVLQGIGDDGNGQIWFGGGAGIASKPLSGLDVEDMFADAEGSGDGGAAEPQLVGGRVASRAGSQGRVVRGLGDDVLVLAVEERDEGPDGAEADGKELREGSEGGGGRRRELRGRSRRRGFVYHGAGDERSIISATHAVSDEM